MWLPTSDGASRRAAFPFSVGPPRHAPPLAWSLGLPGEWFGGGGRSFRLSEDCTRAARHGALSHNLGADGSVSAGPSLADGA